MRVKRLGSTGSECVVLFLGWFVPSDNGLGGVACEGGEFRARHSVFPAISKEGSCHYSRLLLF